MPTPRRVPALAVLAALCVPTQAYAYKYGSAVTSPVHESLTMMAEECLRLSPDKPAAELDCRDGTVSIEQRWRAERRDLRRSLDARGRWTGLALAVRWPDNPERRAAIPFAYRMLVTCHRHREQRLLPAQTGLLCESHAIGLQFLHAQSPVRRDEGGRPVPVCGPGEACDAAMPSEQTRRLTLRWMGVLSRVAAGTVDLDAEFCASEGVDPELRRSLSGSGLCGLSVREVLGSRCRGMGGRRRCRTVVESEAELREIALGAVLHAVQDSFSASHVRRTEERPIGFSPEARCAAVHEFYESGHGYQQERHADADAFPDLVDCDGDVPDPITASAIVIRLVHLGELEDLATFLSERVLPVSP